MSSLSIFTESGMTRVLCILRSLVLAITVAAMYSPAQAQTLFETLVMPGPLVHGHEQLKGTCEKCHEPFSRQAQSALCLDCHKDVAADRRSKSRFHGRDPLASSKDCKHCHTEHKGRDAAIAPLDRETFNHGLTNFKLSGAHTAARCEGCHVAKVKYRAAPSRCIECHRKDEPHKGRLGEDCQSCHTDKSWLPAKTFDHEKTKFPLIGAHKSATCASCHAGEKFRGIGTTCITCHRAEDKHAGRRGEKCETCHASIKWSQSTFNHDRATKFALRGKHAAAKCETCHTGNVYRDKLQRTCVSCHRKDDPHQGQLGTKCETCHAEAGWRQRTSFDHDLTRFPLIGLHAAVPCESCHRTNRFKEAPLACKGCHQDIRHEGRLTSACARCHNPNGWDRWRFDHTRDTRFALTGAHQKAHCHSCHQIKSIEKISLPTACRSCHTSDDVHRGAFGSNCEQCHTTSTFKQKGALR